MKITDVFDLEDVHVALDRPRADELLHKRLRSFGSFRRWWLGRLMAGNMTRRLCWSSHVAVPRAVLFDDYVRGCMGTGGEPVSPAKFGRELLKVAPTTRDCRQTVDGQRLRCYVLPPLREARARFEELIGVPLVWSPADMRWRLD